MRAHKKQFIEWTLLIVLWLSAIPGWSQEEVPFAEENTYITVSGVVKDFRVCQCICSGQQCGDGDKCGW